MFQDETTNAMDELLSALIEEGVERGLGTGVRAAVCCLWNAGYLTGEALAYAAVLGIPEIDPLVVAHLGIYRHGEERFSVEVLAAYEAHEDVVQRALTDLEAAANNLRPQRGEGDDGAGEAPAATQD